MLTLLATACADMRYFAHVTHGQLAIARAREPLAEVIAAPTTDAKLAVRLRLAQDARAFASRHLALPDNRSFTTYVDLHRPYVVWNVFAAPRYSVDPLLHCFPIAGCVPYRGYFDETKAKAEATRLEAEGHDVFVGGVAAYSTLGWFADPILSSMLRWDDDELAGTIFHELAHQLVYVKDDTAFNESFASFVQKEGLHEWRAARGLPDTGERDRARDDEFIQLVLDLRERLRRLYAATPEWRRTRAEKLYPGEMDNPALDVAKQREFEDFRERYRQWRDAQPPDDHGNTDHSRDGFVNAPLNNASLLPFGLYDQWVPAFAALFADANGDWTKFYARVRTLAREPKAQREAALTQSVETVGSPKAPP